MARLHRMLQAALTLLPTHTHSHTHTRLVEVRQRSGEDEMDECVPVSPFDGVKGTYMCGHRRAMQHRDDSNIGLASDVI